MNFRSLLGLPSKEEEETQELIVEVMRLRQGSRLSTKDKQTEFVIQLMEAAADAHDATLGMRIGPTVARLIFYLLAAEPFVIDPSPEPPVFSTLAEGVEYRKRLRRAKKLLSNEDHYLSKWWRTVGILLSGLYTDFPEQALVDPDEQGRFDEYSSLAPTAPLYSFVSDVPLLIQSVYGTILTLDLIDDDLFSALQDRFFGLMSIASGIPIDERYTTNRQLITPLEKRGISTVELIETYLGGTPFADLLNLPIPLPIPEAVRFEHTHILAGTGHGKTQTLQFLIAADLERTLSEKRSLVVMDSQGDLIKTLMRSHYFASSDIRDRFVYINPTDLDRPIGLNLFDFDRGSLGGPVERETILNGTIELYEYFFGGLLGADLTQKQGVVFRYLATLLMHVPDANVHTLLYLMEDGDRFRPYMEQLEGSARAFFATRFFDRTFSETKKQILNRLWGVLSNNTLDRMMGAKRNSVDLFKTLQDGSVVFIDTAKDFLGHEGSVIFGRMFVALLEQALLRRAVIPRHERTPTYIYIDEAEDVMDLLLVRSLAQVRKYKGAITFAHQNLDQLEATIRAGVIANTSIKLAGGVSAKDAHTLAGDFRTHPEFLLHQQRGKHETSFACYAKNVTRQAVTLSIPLGYLESRPQLGEEEYRALIAASQSRYGIAREATWDKVEIPLKSESKSKTDEQSLPIAPKVEPQTLRPPVPATITKDPLASEPTPELVLEKSAARVTASRERPVPGQGGVKHKYLQHLVKELGEERGFRAILEEPIHDGSGRVDVTLSRDDIRLAFEISVTTTKDHELGNIEKCLALSYSHVIMLTSHKRRQTGLSVFILEALDESDRKRVSFLLPEDLPGFLDGYQFQSAPQEKTVKGYKVKSRVKATDPSEALARRRAVAAVVAKSLQT